MRFYFLVLFFLLMINTVFSQNLDYTLEDRERLVRVEEGLKSLNIQMNQRFEALESSINRRLDNLNTFMLWGFGILFTGMLSLVGFTLWDRRSMLSPVIRKSQELEDENRRIKEILREYAHTDEKLLNVAKKVGLL
ncbi:MAG: hypothetical protein FD143_2375 [Ignavibacteria bacterium]|nr:MAG: hypothetical protein FD143_2375 [Ignavibacteria bacterium]KAF0157601.1 MAG: hypothetical protein FD188_2700 [Ignavibacteria bacterium]